MSDCTPPTGVRPAALDGFLNLELNPLPSLLLPTTPPPPPPFYSGESSHVRVPSACVDLFYLKEVNKSLVRVEIHAS